MTNMRPSVGELHVGRGSQLDGLTVFPVWTDTPVVRGLDTGSSALVRVDELVDSPAVDQLVVRNEGKRPALLVEGEMLEGGWQHRTLVRDIILPPAIPQVVAVACVEQGRWHGSARQVRKARRSPAGVRARLRSADGHRQHAVWEKVEQYAPVTGLTPTQSLADQMDLLPLDVAVPAREVKPLPGQRGVLIGLAGRPLLLELFGSSRALAAHLPGLLQGVRLDAALASTRFAPVPGQLARGLASRISGRFLPEVDDAGCGIALADVDGGVSLTGVAMPSGQLAHLSVLNTRNPVLDAS